MDASHVATASDVALLEVAASLELVTALLAEFVAGSVLVPLAPVELISVVGAAVLEPVAPVPVAALAPLVDAELAEVPLLVVGEVLLVVTVAAVEVVVGLDVEVSPELDSAGVDGFCPQLAEDNTVNKVSAPWTPVEPTELRVRNAIVAQ